MCGRYALYDTSKSEFKISNNIIRYSYNITPNSLVPVVVKNNEVQLINWTFKVSWANKLNIVNARSETLNQKKVFQKVNRCIFIANGYFEWLRKDKNRIPYYHTFRNRMMYFGGIFNKYGACIVTRQSYPMKKNVHHRQPVILQYEDFSNWLTFKHDYSCEITEEMDVFEVSKRVNFPFNDSQENIKSIK